MIAGNCCARGGPFQVLFENRKRDVFPTLFFGRIFLGGEFSDLKERLEFIRVYSQCAWAVFFLFLSFLIPPSRG